MLYWVTAIYIVTDLYLYFIQIILNLLRSHCIINVLSTSIVYKSTITVTPYFNPNSSVSDSLYLELPLYSF